jgi:hypothetical protein
MKRSTHITKVISSSIEISSRPEKVWENITAVKIETFPHPYIFRILDIPKPLRAEIIAEGEGGTRVAYFDNNKKFVQKILVWKPYATYSFSFNPESGFRVGYFLDLADGIFQIPQGAYLITEGQKTSLTLQTTYSIHSYAFVLLYIPVTIILKGFQRFLLHAIKKNAEP